MHGVISTKGPHCPDDANGERIREGLGKMVDGEQVGEGTWLITGGEGGVGGGVSELAVEPRMGSTRFNKAEVEGFSIHMECHVGSMDVRSCPS
jgi:hypothetical protein